MSGQKLRIAFRISILLCSFFTATASAQEEKPTPSDDAVNDIAAQMVCPGCENVTLDACETDFCGQWRELIREKLAMGWTEEQITDSFVHQYGNQVLVDPRPRGKNWLIYILPIIFILLYSVLLYRIVRQMHKKSAAIISGKLEFIQHHDTYENRVEEALKERRK